MTPTEALQAILSKIKDSDSAATLADLVGDLEEVAEKGLADQGIKDSGLIFSFNGFESSRRGIDAVLKGAILANGGQVRLTEAEIERYRLGYELEIQGALDGIILTVTERR